MFEGNFTEDDKKKVIDFINKVAKHAEFKMNTFEIVDYFKLLSHMQQVIIPKIESNILEVKRVVEGTPEAMEETKIENKKKGK